MSCVIRRLAIALLPGSYAHWYSGGEGARRRGHCVTAACLADRDDVPLNGGVQPTRRMRMIDRDNIEAHLEAKIATIPARRLERLVWRRLANDRSGDRPESLIHMAEPSQ